MNCVVKEYFPKADVKMLDCLDYMTPVFKRIYPWTYLFLVNYFPGLWGFCYYFLDFDRIDRIVRFFRRITNSINGRRFIEFIIGEKPDLIISTHFLPNEMITSIKERYGIKTFLVTCLTDYYPHAFWRDHGVDLFILPNEESVSRMVELGIPRCKIKIAGIPIHPVFEKKIDKNLVRARLGLKDNIFTILITSGGFGIGPVKELVTAFKKIKYPLQIVVICGNNFKLQDEIKAIIKNSNHNFKIYGFVDNIHELMDASDLLISKAGGLTSSEVMAKSLPLIVVNPIPGQESSNCDFLVKHGSCLKANNTGQVIYLAQKLIENPQIVDRLCNNMRRLAKPQAAREIISLLQKIMNREDNQSKLKNIY